MALALLPLLKLRLALLAAGLLIVAWFRVRRSRRRLIAAACLLALVAAGLLTFNTVVHGSSLKTHNWGELASLGERPPSAYARGAFGLFFDTAFGLFGASPLWVLLLPAAVVLLLEARRLGADLVLLYAPYLVVLAPRGGWYGSWGPPFRYGLVLLPLLTLALIPLLAQRRRSGARALVAGLGVLSLALTLLWVVVPGWTYNFADGTSHVLDQIGTRLRVDAGRLFPSFVRSRAATWIWPPAAFLGAWVLWRGRFGLRRGAGYGAAAVLAMAALSLAAARSLPTRVLELEDAQISAAGGSLYPGLWTRNRHLLRGGRILKGKDRISAPVIAGGGSVTLAFQLRAVGTGAAEVFLQVGADDRILEEVLLPELSNWTRLEVGPLAWPRGAELRLGLRGADGPSSPRVVLDRVDLRWAVEAEGDRSG